MSNYTKTVDFAAKDSLPSGDAGKIVRGTEFDVEFNNIVTAVASKANTNNPTFTGTVVVPNLTVTGNVTMQLGNTDDVTIDGGNY